VIDLLQEAKQKNIESFVLTDINNTSACLDFIREAPKYNVKPIVGIDFREGVKQHYVGIARNNEGFMELNRYLSRILNNEIKLENRAPEFNNSYIIYPFGTIHPSLLHDNEFVGIKQNELNKLRFSEAKHHQHKLVILSPVTFRNKKDFNAHRLLRAIDNNTLLSKLPLSEQASENETMLQEQELQNIYNEFPQLIANTKKIIDDCQINFEFKKSKNKKTFTGNILNDYELLRAECYKGLKERYDNPDESIYKRLEKELQMIIEMDFCSYFLINWDIVKYARERNFFYVGRGSGANSLAAYCLKITDVDPIELDLYFERFINPHRVNPPDFDIDFSWQDRDEIIDYIFKAHGHKHTSLLATYNTFQSRSLIRELGKVFGLPKNEIDDLVDNPPDRRAGRKFGQTPDSIAQLIYKYSNYIHDFPSHLSIHAGGILISEKPIHYYTATSMPPKGYPLTQFSMIEAEDIGLYKFDILSQRGLGHIKDTIEIVKKNKGIDIDIHNIAAFKKDEKIKTLLRTGKTMGCFYVESPAMRMLLSKLRADTYLGLVAASSIIRPGVAKSGMMREYILRFRDKDRREKGNRRMLELMPETFGIMVYQEDVIKVAHYFAGLSLAEADVLRRGMSGKFRGRNEFLKAEKSFFENCKRIGHDENDTREIWRQIESFAGYSFSKGHSASYAVESYQSLYLKAYFPKEFMVGVINNFGGFYRTENYIHEAKMSGANMLAPCINNSDHATVICNDDIYIGFAHIGELEKQSAMVVLLERHANGPFVDLTDFIKRVRISVEQLRILIRVGAFRFTGKSKKELLWEIHSILGSQKKSNPVKELFHAPVKKFQLPQLSHHPLDDALDEMEILGFPLCSPFSLTKNMEGLTVKAAQLQKYTNKEVTIAGYHVNTKITSTSKGQDMCFGTFLDSDGYFFDTVHFPNTLEQFPFRGGGCYLIKGKVVEEFDFMSIEVNYMKKLDVLNRDEVESNEHISTGDVTK